MLNLNLRAAFLVAQVAARIMVKQQSGSIIQMSSQMGHVGAKNRSVYCMTKHGIEGLTKAMAVELSPEGVRVNSVAPTFIETPMTDKLTDDQKSNIMHQIPVGRMGTAAEIASGALYLASTEASYLTGVTLHINGGMAMI